jgi:purine nucleosidase
MKKLIWDTDPGVDGAMPLLFLQRQPAVGLLALTTTFGKSAALLRARLQAAGVPGAGGGAAVAVGHRP